MAKLHKLRQGGVTVVERGQVSEGALDIKEQAKPSGQECRTRRSRRMHTGAGGTLLT